MVEGDALDRTMADEPCALCRRRAIGVGAARLGLRNAGRADQRKGGDCDAEGGQSVLADAVHRSSFTSSPGVRPFMSSPRDARRRVQTRHISLSYDHRREASPMGRLVYSAAGLMGSDAWGEIEDLFFRGLDASNTVRNELLNKVHDPHVVAAVTATLGRRRQSSLPLSARAGPLRA
jgi:hypothetical protein